MPASTTSDELRGLAFFQGLPDTVLWNLARAAERRTLAVDEILFRPGEQRTLLAIIVSGALAIEQQQNGTSVSLTTLGPGEVIGEGILLEDSEHGTFGRATAPTELLFFRKAPLGKLLKDQPALYAALLSRAAKIMNNRIRGANATLLGVTTDGARVRAEVSKWIDDVAALAPSIGYEKAFVVAREALSSGRTAGEVAREQKLVK